MKYFLLLVVFICLTAITQTSAYEYEESISDMLIQCNSYQNEVLFKNRTAHVCEKEDPDGDFSYYITPMKNRYSKREFLCVLFFKDEFSKLDFNLLFSHSQYKIDAVRVRRYCESWEFPILCALL